MAGAEQWDESRRGRCPHGPGRRAGARPVAPGELRARLHRHGTGLGAGQLRSDQGAVYRLGGGSGAAVDAGQWQGMGHRRILDVARFDARAGLPRGRQGQAVRPDTGDPAPHRPLAAGRVRPGGAGRSAGDRRLRRSAGRRRHQDGLDLRRLCGPARRLLAAPVGRDAQPEPVDRFGGRHLGGHHRRGPDARPALRRGLAGRGRHERGQRPGAAWFVEVQGTAEGKAFSRGELDSLLALAEGGIKELSALQAAHAGRAHRRPGEHRRNGPIRLVLASANPDKGGRDRRRPGRCPRGGSCCPGHRRFPRWSRTAPPWLDNASASRRGPWSPPLAWPPWPTTPAWRWTPWAVTPGVYLGPLRRGGCHLRRQRGQAAGRRWRPGPTGAATGAGPLPHRGPGGRSRRGRGLDRGHGRGIHHRPAAG